MRISSGGFSTPFMVRLLLDSGTGEGGGTKTGEEEKPKQATVEDVMKKHGNADAALLWAVAKIHDLEKDNYQQRNETRTLRGQLPASGSRVLTAEEAADLDAYRSLGKPDAIKTVLKEHGDLAKKVAETNREKEVLSVAEENKWNGKALLRVVKDEQFVKIEAKDANGNTIKGDDDKPKQIWAVKGKEEKDAPVPIADHFADVLPALVPPKKEDAETGSPSRDFRRAEGGSTPSGSEKKAAPLFK